MKKKNLVSVSLTYLLGFVVSVGLLHSSTSQAQTEAELNADMNAEIFEDQTASLDLKPGNSGEDTDELPGVDSDLASPEEFRALTVAPSVVNDAPSCHEDFHDRQKELLRRSILNPIIAIPGMAASTAATGLTGMVIGPWITGKMAWGSLLGSSVGLTVGFYGGELFFVAREAILIAKYVDNLRMQKLLDEAKAGSGPILTKLQAKIAKNGSTQSIEDIAARVRELDASRALCDGTMTGNPKPTRKFWLFGPKRVPLRKKLISLRSLAKTLAREELAR